MCGICGILNINRMPVENSVIKEMCRLLKHRGPDDEGLYLDKNVGLGHRRLSVIDLSSAGHQPMSNEDGSIWLTYNGEIYNYKELRKKLSDLGHVFKSNTDSEVVVHSYEQWGMECVNKFNGMWAFVIYDSKKCQLFFSRDRFGIKPLYYYVDKEKIIFASEIKAILLGNNIPKEVNYEALNEYFTFQLYLGNKTLLKNIKRVLPATNMTVNFDGNIKYEKYWDWNYNIDFSITENEAEERIRSIVTDAVKMRLVSDVPLGSYLSGGIDSSIITGIAKNYAKDDFNVFSGTFKDNKEYDETDYAKILSEEYSCLYNEINLSSSQFLDSISDIIYYLDEPVAGPGVFPQYHVSKFASEKVKVVLGGQGGDELFGGYARYLIAYLEQALKYSILEEDKQDENYVVTLNKVLPNLHSLKEYIPLIKQFFSNNLFDDLGIRYFDLINRRSSIDNFLTDDLKYKLDKNCCKEKYIKVFNKKKIFSSIDRMANFDISTLLIGLLQVEDRVSMAHSLESRVPLLDHRIIETLCEIPPNIKFKNGSLKYLLKESMKDILPVEIYNRKDKKGFPVPLNDWLNNPVFKKRIIDEILSLENSWFDKNRLELFLNSEFQFGRSVWAVLNLSLWAKNYKISI